MKTGVISAISKDDLANLPVRRYEGTVCLVTTLQDLERAVTDILQESVVGFDTETRPAFRKGEFHLPCLVQAATARAVYLFALRESEPYAALAQLLAASHIVKAGVAVARDLQELKLVFPFTEQNILDLGIVARRRGLAQTGLRNLAGIFLGFRVPKGAKTTNWAATRLSAAQITYAATDAWVSRELFLHFERLGWVAAKASP